jgi:hypothetical protein
MEELTLIQVLSLFRLSLQLKRACKKGQRVYLAVIKPIADPVDTFVKDNSGLPRSASNYMATDIPDPSGK